MTGITGEFVPRKRSSQWRPFLYLFAPGLCVPNNSGEVVQSPFLRSTNRDPFFLVPRFRLSQEQDRTTPFHSVRHSREAKRCSLSFRSPCHPPRGILRLPISFALDLFPSKTRLFRTPLFFQLSLSITFLYQI